MAATPLRTVRVPTYLWDAALRTAQTRGETISDIIRAALVDYLAKAGTGPARPIPVDEELATLAADAGYTATFVPRPPVKAPAGTWFEPITSYALGIHALAIHAH